MLKFGSQKEFEDPSLEYRRLCAELLGTLFLVLAAADGGILHTKGPDQPVAGGRRARS